MNPINNITDGNFLPFLQSLGVETYNISIEWMLDDPAFAEVLQWLFNNLDQNNALNAREEYRYKEIEKHGKLLSPVELETSVASILEEYPGVCLPGDQEGLEDVKLDISMQKDRLIMLKKHEQVLEDLVNHNEQIKIQLDLEVTKLHAAEQQGSDDVSSAADECLQLAEDVESITERVIEVIDDTLELYTNCHADKDLSKKFLSFGPFETYRQSQALFRSHFDLFTTKWFDKKQKNNVTDEDWRAALIEAKSMEDRLSEAALAYVESKAELTGLQAKLAFIANYSDVHPSQVTACKLEAESALELLEQEETMIESQMHHAARAVRAGARAAAHSAVRAALQDRLQILSALSQLHTATTSALSLDRALYAALRRELRSAAQAAQLAALLRDAQLEEAEAVRTRIDSMNAICAEQKSCLDKLQSSDPLTETLSRILGVSTTDAVDLVRVYGELVGKVKELDDDINEAFAKKEEAVIKLEKSHKPLCDTVCSGSTRQPRAHSPAAAALAHRLTQEMESVDKMVLEAGGLFASVKNGDKKCMRKLWQWFLTDPNKLVATLKGVSRNYS